MELPALVYDYNDARIESFTVGPRREITLNISVVSWKGSKGRYATPTPIRFGGIKNFDEVVAFFRARPFERSELQSLRYSKDHKSKPGHLFIAIAFERNDSRIVILCSNLNVAGSRPREKKQR